MPLDAYGDLPGIEQMAISPNGHLLAILSRVKADRRVLVINPDDGKVKINASIGDAKLRGLAWAGDGMVLITTTATVSLGPDFTADKYELAAVLVVPVDGGKPHQVFERSPQIAHTVRGDYGVRQIGGRWVGYYGGLVLSGSAATGTHLDSGNPALFQVDLATNTTRMVAHAAGEGHIHDWLVDAAGQVAATFDLNRTSGKWSIVNAANKPLASGVDPTGDIGLLFLSQDGASVVYSADDDAKGVTDWLEVPLAGGKPQQFLGDKSIERSFVDGTSGRLIGYLERGENKGPHMFDAARQIAFVKVYRAFPRLDVDPIDWTPDFAKMLVHTSGSGDSGTWYIVDIAAKTAGPVGYDRPIIQPDQVGPISSISYKATDGLEMDGVLTLPPGRDPHALPVVLLPHGGPSANDDVLFDWWAQAFASRGYAVFQPNFRGSTNRSDAFRRAGNGQWGRAMQTDISDGLAELAKRGIVDPKRACIVGASYGGYAALAGVTLQHGVYRCAVAVAPVADLTEMYHTDNYVSGDSLVMSRSLREQLGLPATFAAVSPRRHAAQADAPILLIHGKDDTVVPFHQSAAMANALRDAGKPVEMVVMQQEDHWLSRAATRKQMLNAAVAFVEKHDPPN